ncbi:hypothetical protein HPA02_34850 [Bisbaumannia pacifica]|uniref:Uncharacterized protein n=1 Tax=Bisbaumannia pacifica TaxID=77098 RepID=A0A510XCN6_9GAMM|nr:hypothetical protein HPA02_34850 [Halomonas pacifica]
MMDRLLAMLAALLLSFGAIAAEPAAETTDPSPPAVYFADLEASVACDPVTLDAMPDEVILAQGCCRVCRTGKACGNSCINRSYTCHQPPGCACNG